MWEQRQWESREGPTEKVSAPGSDGRRVVRGLLLKILLIFTNRQSVISII